MSNDDGVTTFAGFGSWMSTLAPAPGPQTSQVHEMSAETSQNHYVTHQAFELAAEVTALSPAAAPTQKPSPPSEKYEVHGDNVFEPTKHKDQPIKLDPFVTLVIKGLRKLNTDRLFQEVIEVPLFCSLYHVNDVLLKKGYKLSAGFGFTPMTQPNLRPNSLPVVEPIELSDGFPQWPVLVTDGPSCYDPKEGLRINRKETLAEYCSRLQVQVRCVDSQLVINNDLRIGFHRTLRVPEDQKIHNLPASFGYFPLQNVAAYSNKLKKSNNPSLLDMAKKSGVFFTMYQREAMWISFQVAAVIPASEYAIRVFAGGINVVSGRKWDNPEPQPKRKQDYVLVPPQKHLDGIAISSETVRQFIAMPIGSGYSIEKQMTGKEDVGGIQVEINPAAAKLTVRLHPGNSDTLEPSGKSAADYGISSGSEIFLCQDSNGKVVMGRQPEEHKYTLLRELIGEILIRNTYTITALYPTKLKIIVPSRFSKKSVITKEFSPFAKLREVTESTKVSDIDVSGYHFSLALKTPRLPPLSPSSTLIGTGIINHEGLPTSESDLPIIIATKPDGKTNAAVKPTHHEPTRLKKNRLSSMFRHSPEYPQQAFSPVQPHPMYPRMSTNQYPSPSSYNSPSSYSSPSPYYSPSPYSSPTQSIPSTQYSSPSFYSTPTYSSAPQQSYQPSQQSYQPPQQSYQQPQQSYSPPQQSYSSPQQSYSPPQQSYQPPQQSYQQPQQSYSPPQQSYQSSSQSYQPGPSYSVPNPTYGSPNSSYGAPARNSSAPSPSAASNPPGPQSPKAPAPKEDAWTMGIAAGGKLRQQIFPDNDIYRMSHWNKTATSMINIQVLNSVAYETITGLVAPPTPITLENYLSAGIPFYSSYKSGQAAQVSGATNFRVIKSVSEMDISLGIDDGVSVAASQRVACSSCRRNLCDCVLRPCNHAFCSTCVYTRMNVHRKKVVCYECQRVADSILGFSAPMSLPGEEVIIPKDVPVIILPGLTGLYGSVAELG